MILETTSL
jgi:hypothetical protein